ncbi:tyrosine-type recombinase/integrase [Enterococcus pallens]|uniref:Tyr recombinase domain-containing protein n=1 Tax=Enterococcus pallens ATCC BAA-351 TaxID=1158607 RepID=R2QB85_9ENTE|nr:site-specific integrase [Enterococcus pallens]EOH92473.1 hypothetical protein UAU_02925 [Enterococcus pallens ATCC BAA-351]EOU25058.1 hypothetical protein I588_01046 [Enterococcus pallens ATCC BAA-351]
MRRGENIYKRKDKRWEGRYAVGKKANGRKKYRSVYGKTLQEVRKKLYPLKLKYQILQEVQGSSCISLQEWGMIWLRDLQAEIKPSTYANYEHKLTHYVLSVIGEYGMNELNEEIGGTLLQSLQQRRLKASTIKVIFRITNQCLNYAIEKQQLNVNPFSRIKLPKVKKAENQALSKQAQKDLEKTALAEANGKGLSVLMALHAGLRIGETAALTWNDVDFERNLICVKSTLQRISGIFGSKKTKLIHASSKTAASIRVIPMSQTLRKVLLEHKIKSEGNYVLSTNLKPSEPRLLTYHFHRIRKKAKLPDIHFHQLRHTFATRCIESKGDIKSVSYLMGHSSVKLTLDTYTDSLLDQRIQVVEQMEEAIR